MPCLRLKGVLKNLAVFHDQANGFDAFATWLDVEHLRVPAKHLDVFQRIAIHQDEVGVGAVLDYSQLVPGYGLFFPVIAANSPPVDVMALSAS